MPVAFAGQKLGELREHRFKAGDRVTVVAELPDLERLLRREAIPTTSSAVIDSYPVIARDKLVLLVRSVRHCEKEEAEATVNGPFTLASGLTHGEAQELVELVARDECVARVIVTREPGVYGTE